MSKSQKGSTFEREMCKQLSLWFSGNTRDDLFWRSASSGGRATIRSRQGAATAGSYGDITATHPRGKLLMDMVTIELKRGYSKWSFADAIDRKRNRKPTVFEQFVEQTVLAAEANRRDHWWLITRRDSKDALLFFNISFNHWLEGKLGRSLNTYDIAPLLRMRLQVKYKSTPKLAHQMTIVAMRLDDFMRIVSPDIFHK